MLHKDPQLRITPEEALKHKYFKVNKLNICSYLPSIMEELISDTKKNRSSRLFKKYKNKNDKNMLDIP